MPSKRRAPDRLDVGAGLASRPRDVGPTIRGNPRVLSVLAVQRTAGNRAVTQALGRGSTAPGDGVARTNRPEVRPFVPGQRTVSIQRKVGFEFEDGAWKPWKVDWDEARRRQPAVTPVPRKKVLQAGNGFRLEADDTPAPASSNIEFVTDPFDETDAGAQSFVRTVLAMRDLHNRLVPLRGKTGPTSEGPPYLWNPSMVVWDHHQLQGSADVPGRDLALSGGSERGQFKMQATMGLTLSEIPEVMHAFGRVPEGQESQLEATRRAPTRALSKESGFSRIFGAAPTLADQVLEALVRTVPALQHRLYTSPADRRAAQGYVALAMTYLKGLRFPSPDVGAKTRTFFLARNKFSDMYGMLPQPYQDLFAQHNGQTFADAMLRVSNGNPMWRKSRIDDNLAPNTPLFQFHQSKADANRVMAPFGVGTWLLDVAQGRDQITAQAMAAWLQANAQVSREEATTTSADVLEGFGEYALDRTGSQALALLENRAILDGSVAFRDAVRVAYNYLLFASLLKTNGPGQTYPDDDVPGY